MHDVEMSRQAQRRLHKQDKRKRGSEDINNGEFGEITLLEAREVPNVRPDNNIRAPPPTVGFGSRELEIDRKSVV